MTTVGSSEAKTPLPELLERVARGEKILITKRGEPIALLVPPPRKEDRDVKEVIEAFKAYSRQQGRTLAGLSIRETIEEGRQF